VKKYKMAKRVLKTVVFMGSSRDMKAFWGGDKRLGDRVLKHVVEVLTQRKSNVGSVKVEHDITVFDPLEVFGEEGALKSSGSELKTPHFYFKAGSAPKEMEEMRTIIRDADAYRK